MKDAVALFAKDFPPTDFTLYPIAQERFGKSLVTVFRQGGVQVSLETEFGFFIASLPPSFSVCKLSTHADLFFLEGQNHLAVYTKRGECVFLEQVLHFSADEKELNATMPLSDTLGRVAECRFLLYENGCESTSFTLRQTRAFDGDTAQEKIAEELLPFAFFESVLIGADFRALLSDELADKADELRSFLGDFVAVTLAKDAKTCGLVRKKAERLFEVDYFTAETENGKIIDIKG